MAEFCGQCSFDMWGEAIPNDFSGLTTTEEWENNMAAGVLCEGCGGCQVDPNGMCVTDCMQHHDRHTPEEWLAKFIAKKMAGRGANGRV